MRWTVIDANQADAPAPRYGHAAVVVDARDDWGTELVIVHGGATKLSSDQESFLEDVSVFQVECEAWVRPQISSPLLPGPRAFHSAVAVGKTFVFFGGQALIPNTTSRTTFNDVWILSVDSWAWKKITPRSEFQPTPRSLSSMVHLGNGRVLVFGGMNESSKALNDLWIFHVDQAYWLGMATIGTPPLPRIKQAMAYVDGALWLYGGETTTGTFFDDLWMLKELEGTGQWQWTSVKSKPKPLSRSGHCFTPIHDSLIISFAGHTPSPVYMIFSQSHYYNKDVYIFDPLKNRWVKCDPPEGEASPMERVCPIMVNLSSGKLLMFGGRGRDKILGDCWWLELDMEEVRTPSSHSLSSLASSAVPMHQMGRRSPHHVKTEVSSNRSHENQSAPPTPFLGTVWNNIGLPRRRLLNRLSQRSSNTSGNKDDELVSPQSKPDLNKVQEMSFIGNEHREEKSQLDEGLSELYGQFNIDLSDVESTIWASIPDDHYIDTALISFAQSISSQFAQKSSSSTQDSILLSAREALMHSDAREFKLGNLWLLLADYKRLVLKKDVLNAWREEQAFMQPRLQTRFLHCTLDNLRLSDLPELLLDYKHLVESL